MKIIYKYLEITGIPLQNIERDSEINCDSVLAVPGSFKKNGF